MNKHPLTERQFKTIYSKVPRLCVDLMIVQGKKILLTKRSISPYKGMWHFPGGTVRHKEKITRAIKRISKNELGIIVFPEKLFGYIEGRISYRHDVSLVFKCRIKNKEKPLPLDQSDEVKFFDKLPRGIIPYHRSFIKNNYREIFN